MSNFLTGFIDVYQSFNWYLLGQICGGLTLIFLFVTAFVLIVDVIRTIGEKHD